MRVPFQHRLHPLWGFYVLDGVGLTVALVHLLTEGEGVGTVLEALILVVMAGILLYSGHDLSTRDLSRRCGVRALKLTCLAVVTFGLLAVAIAAIWTLEHAVPSDARFMVVFAGGLGGAVGSQASLYTVQAEQELARNRDLTKILKMNERVLRHNLRNELAIAFGHLDNLEDDLGSTHETEQIRIHLDELLDLSRRTRRIVSIWETDARVEFSVADLLTDRVRHLREKHPDASVSVSVSENHAILGHPMLPAAIDEALENAVVHTGPDAEVTATCLTDTRDGYVVIEIADTGPGLDALEKRALFQPEETALEHGQGLGLWLIYWTVVKSDGELDFRENTPQGTVVELRLPPATERRNGPRRPRD